MEMNRIKWNEDMTYRCINKAKCFIFDDEKEKNTSNSKHINKDINKNIIDVSKNNKKKTEITFELSNYETDNAIIRTDFDAHSTNTKNDFYGIGVGQCIECQVTNGSMF